MPPLWGGGTLHWVAAVTPDTGDPSGQAVLEKPTSRDRRHSGCRGIPQSCGEGSAIASSCGYGGDIAVVGALCSRGVRSGSPSGARADRAVLAACVRRVGRSRPSPSGVTYSVALGVVRNNGPPVDPGLGRGIERVRL